ncbi:hypothetical protein LI147_18260, partial [Blautia wexlerae]|nr:hypothetical protein [Blautia wexlerae]
TSDFQISGSAISSHKNIQYIESFPVQSMEYKILSLFFYQYKTDSEIASILHVSRQYINRQKKKLLKTYFFRHPD